VLVPPRDPGALATALLDLLADAGRRDAMGAGRRGHIRGRRRIVEVNPTR
jgi:glycosyltransferase involved in cell wall biosynthesis